METEAEVLARFKRRYAAVRPSPRIFWADFPVTATLAWGGGFGAALAPTWWAQVLCFVVAIPATVRAVYYVHEIVHFGNRKPWGFVMAWRLLAGWPTGIATFMVWPHADHHHNSTYGTVDDPEYEPVARWPRWRWIPSLAQVLLVPPLLVLRWTVLAPLSWMSPPLRRLTIGKLSTLATNAAYTRALPEDKRRRRLLGEEAALMVWWGAVAAALVTGVIPWVAFGWWWAVAASALVANQLRTLVAHFYASPGTPMSRPAQVADSMTYGGDWFSFVFAPVGTQYHALHHLMPHLPFHALGPIHRELMAALPPDASYRQTVYPGLRGALAFAWRRARTPLPPIVATSNAAQATPQS